MFSVDSDGHLLVEVRGKEPGTRIIHNLTDWTVGSTLVREVADAPAVIVTTSDGRAWTIDIEVAVDSAEDAIRMLQYGEHLEPHPRNFDWVRARCGTHLRLNDIVSMSPVRP